MSIRKITDLELAGKRVLIRSDLNVPIKDGQVVSDVRILASLPTIEHCLHAGAKVMVTSHLGRPTEGEYDELFSLSPVVACLSRIFNRKVSLVKDYINGLYLNSGELVVLENVRFNSGEQSNEKQLSKKYAALCDIFVMDAFGAAHRAQASTYGVGIEAPISCAGLLLSAELDALSKAMASPERPLVAIVGGSKVSSKLSILEKLSQIADYLIVGGGIANTFISASGYNIGKSLYEVDLVKTAKKIMRNSSIPIATDVACAKVFDENAKAEIKSLIDVQDDDMIFDLGPNSISNLIEIISKAKTILWNGPVGVFEFKNFSSGTIAVSKAIAKSSAFSLAGGGDTIAAIDKFGIKSDISYISTGGGAFLEFVEGKSLPVLDMLQERAL
ncbi:phosphoglycerate kinase [Candidatus Photodesmus katoptron]|uniref:Phosphoglycerate kinase n=1 Tax=Candidatus Photodesmus katoptron Akat1 TaxID=1236703 RepID=S3DHH8_9GAMM|nr:phosphoglycerate kinase [Candidatus Photodesmus katoptron]EPE37882.1 phosphoglycerate kinase [Candidatus Photodesmus katoptron Akat1]KEY90399.1 phosphoglycerate kinase [Candidatus Photodesmus katoptron]